MDIKEMKSKYSSSSTACDVLSGIDLGGKTIFITGTTNGIGRETARSIAISGAHVVMANRNDIESEKLKAAILEEKADAKIDIIKMDLSSLESVKSAANEFISKNWPLHVLILNAAVFMPTIKQTLDGFDATFGVNYLGHFYLTLLLLDKLRQSAPSRLVVVTSYSHQHNGISSSSTLKEKLNILFPEANSSHFSYRLYAISKLNMILMAMKLHRAENSNGISTYSVHPGMISTGISRSLGFISYIWAFLMKPFAKSIAQGAATTVYCAASDETTIASGKYYSNCQIDEYNLSREIIFDETLQDAVWEKTVDILKNYSSISK